MDRKKWLKNEKLVKFTMIQLLKLYLELDHLLMINNEYTPKNVDFFRKYDESTL